MTPMLAFANLSLTSILGTVTYTVIGIALMLAGIVAANVMFKLDLYKELVKDQNVAFGVMIAGYTIGVAIIIAASFF